MQSSGMWGAKPQKNCLVYIYITQSLLVDIRSSKWCPTSSECPFLIQNKDKHNKFACDKLYHNSMYLRRVVITDRQTLASGTSENFVCRVIHPSSILIFLLGTADRHCVCMSSKGTRRLSLEASCGETRLRSSCFTSENNVLHVASPIRRHQSCHLWLSIG
jgi:hypothetical protein